MKNIIISLITLLTLFVNSTVSKKALIFGVTGQDGTYLSEFLLKRGYEVHGVKRRSSSSNTHRIDYLLENTLYRNKFFLHYGDLADTGNIIDLLQLIEPDEVYNLAAQSHVSVSFEIPEETANVDGLGVLRILDAIKKIDKTKKIKFYQASSSEMFGDAQENPQTELSSFHPRSPYSVSKLFGYWMTINYREAFNIFACNGILFNHESPIRGETFVTRKISLGVAKIHFGLQDIIYLGNLDSKRDWGYAKDYVEAMWLMLQQEKPDDYIIATGQTHTVREFVELAFKEIGINIGWQGVGIDEFGFDKTTKNVLIKIDPQYFRPSEINCMLGDSSKANKVLQWKPKTSFEDLVKQMVQQDIKKLRKQLIKKN